MRLLKALEQEGRPATPEERKTLARYVGWGGLKGAFDPDNKAWAARFAELKELLTPAEYKAARASILDSHYTAPVVVKAMYGALERMGFNGGRVLESSVGIGNFFGMMPRHIRHMSELHGTELDSLTARMVAQIYPDATIRHMGFQDFEIPAEFFDLSIGNPPFGSSTITDPDRGPYSGWSTHNYFLAKQIDKLRPGGIMAVVVSRYFLDAQDATTRKWIDERADLIAAVRLPNTAFKVNALTEVVTDVLVFQKRDGAPSPHAILANWLIVGEQKLEDKDGQEVPIKVNEIYLKNPDWVLGKPAAAGTMYSAGEYTVLESPGRPLEAGLRSWAERVPRDIYQRISRDDPNTRIDMEIPDGVKVGGFFVDADGVLMRRSPDVMGARRAYPYVPKYQTNVARIKGMVQLRDLMRTQLRLEKSQDANERQIEGNRARLNEVYDAFIKAHGLVNSRSNRSAFMDDPEAHLIQGLEFKYDEGVTPARAEKDGLTARAPSAKKADIFTRRVAFPPQDYLLVTSAQDALLASLNYRGTVDREYIEQVYEKPWAETVKELGDAVYEDPTMGVVLADEYLSGDVKTKLTEARYAARGDDRFARNVKALEKVQPRDRAPHEITVNIGAAFVPVEIYQAFARHITGAPSPEMAYVPHTGQWMVEWTGRGDQALTDGRWGTSSADSFRLFELILAGKGPVVMETVDGRRFVNEEKTEAARAKVEAIKTEWAKWIWADPDRGARVRDLFNEKLNRTVPRRVNGSHLTLPGISPAVELLPHQLNGIWRGLQIRQILLDHVVGAGKTFQMVAMAMEMRRLGIARKPMIVVPNHLTVQWRDEFARLYPGSAVLAASPSDFDKEHRERLFARIATGDWDAVIVGHSALKHFGLPKETELAIIQEQIDEISAAIEEMKRGRGDRNVTRDMENIKKNLEDKLRAALAAIGKRSKMMTFDEFGIDALMVDELHEFKNLSYVSTMDRNPGMGNPAGSAKAYDLFVKIRWLMDHYGPKVPLVGATGTPVSNSLVEMFNMQRFMQYPLLKEHGVHVFDAWARQYGQAKSVYEVSPSGTGYRQSLYFGQFNNMASLMGLYRSMADTVTMDDLKAQEEARGKAWPVPQIEGGKPTNIIAKRSQKVAEFMGELEVVRDENGTMLFEWDIENFDRVEEVQGQWYVVGKGQYGMRSKGFETEPDARAWLVSAALTPRVAAPPNSIIGQFANLKALFRTSRGRINALSLTNQANNASLDYRVIEPTAADSPESKVNLAVGEMLRLYKKWDKDSGTQLVFLDRSIPLSVRAKFGSEERAVYVRGDKQAIIKARGTLHTAEGAEDLPFFVVMNSRRGGAGEKLTDTYVFDATTGRQMGPGTTGEKRGDAVAKVRALLATPEGRARWAAEAAKSEEVTPEEIDAFLEANQIDPLEVNAYGLEEVASAANPSRFSVYDDIRDKLIRAGVPAREIAFIHDYDTPVAKQKLFAEVNAGRVRFLFGSTQKMGAGTNVQERVVGLHHIDAPWRPSDLEQREGRVIRRDNKLYDRDPEGFRVFIGRYATGETYDTRRWQIIEHKASVIEQLRRYTDDMNELEDVAQGEASNAADMKAAASGDPLILAEVQARNEVRRLELLESAHASQRIDMNSRARYAEYFATERGPAHIREVRKSLDKVVPKDRKAPQYKPEDGPAVEGDAYHREVTRTFTGLLANLTKSAQFDYRGMRFKFERESGYINLASPLASRVTYWVDSQDTFSPRGLLDRLDNYLATLPGELRDTEEQMKTRAAEAVLLREQAGKPFEHTQALADVRVEHARVRRELLRKGPPVPAREKAEVEKEVARRRELVKAAGLGDALAEVEGAGVRFARGVGKGLRKGDAVAISDAATAGFGRLAGKEGRVVGRFDRTRLEVTVEGIVDRDGKPSIYVLDDELLTKVASEQKRWEQITEEQNRARVAAYLAENEGRMEELGWREAKPGERFYRVVWDPVGDGFIEPNAPDVVNLPKGADIAALHVTNEPESWDKQLREDYGRYGRSRVIEIAAMPGDIVVDDPQQALPSEIFGRMLDSAILVTGRAELKRDARSKVYFSRGPAPAAAAEGPQKAAPKPVAANARILNKLRRLSLTPVADVVQMLGPYPEYLDALIQFMMEQRRKVLDGTLTVRDVAKAYALTVASMGSDAKSWQAIAKYGFVVPEEFRDSRGFVRPEEAMAAWLFSPDGQRALDALERGEVDAEAWRKGADVRKGYGDDRFGHMQVLTKGLQLLPSVVEGLNASRGKPAALAAALRKLPGIGVAKTAFVKHLLGFGDAATIDAVEINLWLTGQGDVKRLPPAAKAFVQEIKGQSDNQAVMGLLQRKIAARFEAIRKASPEAAATPREVFAHVLHHWIWDRAKGTETTHAQLYDAMMRAQRDEGAKAPGPSMTVAEVDRAAKEIAAKTQSLAKVEVVPTEDDLHPFILQAAEKEGARGELRAVMWGDTLYIVADQMEDRAAVEGAFAHELAHFGLRRLLGSSAQRYGARLFALVGGDEGIRQLAADHGFDMEGYFRTADSAAYRNDPAARAFLLADELLAHLEQHGPKSLPARIVRALQEFVGAVRAWMRSNGWAELAKFRDADLFHQLRRIREAGRARGREVAGKQVRFMREAGQAVERAAQGRDESRPTDARYADLERQAVAGDTGAEAEAQRMVDEAAKAAGYNVGPVYHGNREGRTFSVFDPKAIGRYDAGYHGWGFYFTQEQAKARGMYGAGQEPVAAYLKLTNPLEVTHPSNGDVRGVLAKMGYPIRYPKEMTRQLLDQGHDGVIIRRGTDFLDQKVGDIVEALVLDDSWDTEHYDREQGVRVPRTPRQADSSNRIKSADPFTYNDQGELIPLSERFRAESPDIRFSRGGGVPVGSYAQPGAIGPTRVTIEGLGTAAAAQQQQVAAAIRQAMRTGQPPAAAPTGAPASSSPPAPPAAPPGGPAAAPSPGEPGRLKDWLTGAMTDAKGGGILATLTLRMLADVGEHYLPQLSGLVRGMQGFQVARNRMFENATGRVAEWRQFGKEEAGKIAEIMNESTIAQWDPSKPNGGAPVFDVAAAKKRIAHLTRLYNEHPGQDAKTRDLWKIEKDELIAQVRLDAYRKRNKDRIEAMWAALTPKAKDFYKKVRDDYVGLQARMEKAILERIKKAELDEETKKAAALQVRADFEQARLKGPYFPLYRHGRFYAVLRKPTGETYKDRETGEEREVMERSYQMFDTPSERRKALAEARADGWEVMKQGVTQLTGDRAMAEVSEAFIADSVARFRKDLGRYEGDKAAKVLYQSFLATMPYLSHRVHFINRRKTPGYSEDALRAYAFNSAHTANQIARQEQLPTWEAAMREAEQHVKDVQASAPEGDATWSESFLNEARARFDWLMNPKGSAWASQASAIGFLWYLGYTPAAALVNLTQTPVIALPELASHYTYPAAARALRRSMRQALGARRHLKDRNNYAKWALTPEERDLMTWGHDVGVIDTTQVGMLMGMAETDSANYSHGWTRAMEIAGALFSDAEVVNRQATLLAAYRLERARNPSGSMEQARELAARMVWNSHYDYSNLNRARVMQGDAARVLLQFKSYAAHTTYYLVRNAYQATKDESPEVRREARRRLAGVVGMTAALAGTSGLPFAIKWAIMGTYALAALLFGGGDDGEEGTGDEPWDTETEWRSFLARAGWLGQVVDRGLVNATLGVDLSSRVGMDQLWWRDADRELDAQKTWQHGVEQLLGPVVGIGGSFARGADLMADGEIWRGFEAMTPKALKDQLRAVRYAVEGVKTLKGDDIVPREDVGIWDIAQQAMGFTSDQIRAQWDENAMKKDYEQYKIDRRSGLLGAYAMAHAADDEEGMDRALEAIDRYNERRVEGEKAITGRDRSASIRSRARYRDQSEGGIYIQPQYREGLERIKVP